MSGIATLLSGCSSSDPNEGVPTRQGKVETVEPPAGTVPPEQRGGGNGQQTDGG
ncbi:MAG: hypothetical protein KF824_00405 [Fimbriimonadaceae bacterium]|nr:MAG: hypothetical protein KF824_00405 [Fimbriimonadaceae bacterium]